MSSKVDGHAKKMFPIKSVKYFILFVLLTAIFGIVVVFHFTTSPIFSYHGNNEIAIQSKKIKSLTWEKLIQQYYKTEMQKNAKVGCSFLKGKFFYLNFLFDKQIRFGLHSNVMRNTDVEVLPIEFMEWLVFSCYRWL